MTLAITGLILSLGKAVLLPLIGYTLFSWLAILAKNVHNFIGPILIVAVPWLFLRFVRNNGIGTEDVKWFLNIFGYFKGHEYPCGKFNAGEKLVFWLVLVVCSDDPGRDRARSCCSRISTRRGRRCRSPTSSTWSPAYVAVALALVHIYLGTIGMAGAYRAMRDGYVERKLGRASPPALVPEGRRRQGTARNSCSRRLWRKRQSEPSLRCGGHRGMNMMTSFRALGMVALTLATVNVAVAKLPAPGPLTDAQKVAAEEKQAKAAAAAALASQQLEKSMDRAAANYFADMKAKGKAAPPAQLGPTAAAAKPAAAPMKK